MQMNSTTGGGDSATTSSAPGSSWEHSGASGAQNANTGIGSGAGDSSSLVNNIMPWQGIMSSAGVQKQEGNNQSSAWGSGQNSMYSNKNTMNQWDRNPSGSMGWGSDAGSDKLETSSG